MAARQRGLVWDERTLKRLALARADGVPSRELAARFGVASQTLDRKLAELRAHPQFLDNPLGYLMKPPGLGELGLQLAGESLGAGKK
jgi:hypothetical protein